LLPLQRGQQIDGKLLDRSGDFQGLDPEILLPGLAEDLLPEKRKALGYQKDVGHILGFPPAQGAELVRKDVPPVVDAGIKSRLLKIAVAKRHMTSRGNARDPIFMGS